MNSDPPTELNRELLDDFYSECDELLTSTRDGLVQLERIAGKQEPEPAVVEPLFRNIHSLKGISAIVGLRPAEELAHRMEEILRGLSKRTIALTESNVDALLAGAQRLEQIVTGHRLGKSLPDIGDVLDRFRPSGAEASAPSGSGEAPPAEPPPAASKPDPADDARSRGLRPCLVSFTPSAALDRRGINVSAVRERLKAIGQILSAVPLVGEGGVRFEFVVGVREMPSDLSAWENDGIRIGPAPQKAGGSGASPAAAASELGFVESLSLTPSHVLRVDLMRIDELMRITGEMVVHRSRLEDRINQAAGGADTGLREINLALARSLREMREAISHVRMVPIAEIFARMPFVVRDLARDSDKKVRVSIEGGQTEVDKYLVERLKEPLLHLVRNAFVHGVEPSATRAAAGKPPEATILLQAKSVGESVVIQIRDDGRGIDSEEVLARAGTLGLNPPATVDANGLLKILCAPGFSTRDQADLAAGRGVGMAIVDTTVRELGGTLALETSLGAGTEFTLTFPLTLSIADAIIVSVGAETCAVPQSAVEEILQVPARHVRRIRETAVIPYRGGLLPLVRLRTLFGLPEAPAESVNLLVVSAERGSAGLVVDRVRAQREIVIRPLADPLLQVSGVSGATELGDGRPILILDPIALTQGVVRPSDPEASPASIPLENHSS